MGFLCVLVSNYHNKCHFVRFFTFEKSVVTSAVFSFKPAVFSSEPRFIGFAILWSPLFYSLCGFSAAKYHGNYSSAGILTLPVFVPPFFDLLWFFLAHHFPTVFQLAMVFFQAHHKFSHHFFSWAAVFSSPLLAYQIYVIK